FPIRIGSETIEMDRELFQTLKGEVARACENSIDQITVDDHSLRVADVQDTFERLGLDRLGNETAPVANVPAPPADQDAAVNDPPDVDARLVSRQNLDSQVSAVAYAPRAIGIDTALPIPTPVPTRPKPHQTIGFDWLVSSYRAGWPGVLLADD